MEPGERVGRYVIEALLGVGGMGEVYRAYDEVLRRRIAIKLLRTDVGDPSDGASSVRRVLREARMAASLEHPNVVAIHDVGEHAGTSFIVMELIKGRSLRSLVGAGTSVPSRACRSLRPLSWLLPPPSSQRRRPSSQPAAPARCRFRGATHRPGPRAVACALSRSSLRPWSSPESERAGSRCGILPLSRRFPLRPRRRHPRQHPWPFARSTRGG